ncbi:MAG TPA: DUF948 domain-containing protein [Syntrophales bacterium]|jgi:uncharacterized protein YoxC|nr:DUF948 domain-containing protein [Syntrophales bacterium]HPX55911.1 DUF948 domain-containing protein [Syntrophales bacterium]HQA81987.1 DUF948 domain-containing protein [Syntrophales bacterium]
MLEISFVILSIAFLLLAGSLAAVFFQLWKILQRLHPAVEQLNRSLPGILRNVEDTTARIRDVSTHVHFQVENLSHLLNQLHALMAVIPVVEGSLKTGILRPVLGGRRNLAALWKGVSTFVRTFVACGDKKTVS